MQNSIKITYIFTVGSLIIAGYYLKHRPTSKPQKLIGLRYNEQKHAADLC